MKKRSHTPLTQQVLTSTLALFSMLFKALSQLSLFVRTFQKFEKRRNAPPLPFCFCVCYLCNATQLFWTFMTPSPLAQTKWTESKMLSTTPCGPISLKVWVPYSKQISLHTEISSVKLRCGLIQTFKKSISKSHGMIKA